jgi:hypothetical protein
VSQWCSSRNTTYTIFFNFEHRTAFTNLTTMENTSVWSFQKEKNMITWCYQITCYQITDTSLSAWNQDLSYFLGKRRDYQSLSFSWQHWSSLTSVAILFCLASRHLICNTRIYLSEWKTYRKRIKKSPWLFGRESPIWPRRKIREFNFISTSLWILSPDHSHVIFADFSNKQWK